MSELDIADQLRKEAKTPRYMAGDGLDWCEVEAGLLRRAADEIDRLQARVEEAKHILYTAATDFERTASSFGGKP